MDPYGTRRWWVHVGLIASFAVSVLVILARMGVGLHILAGLGFTGLVGAHLIQRRRTLRSLAASPTWRTRRGRLALSDAVLVFLALNVVLSGVADWASAQVIMVGRLNWHTTSSVLLVVYVVVHVVRRRARLRHSQIR
jgi:hypothetical protein